MLRHNIEIAIAVMAKNEYTTEATDKKDSEFGDVVNKTFLNY